MKQCLSSSIILLAVAVLTSLPALAQPGSGGPTPGAVTAVPIDGGASLLLVGGIALGLKQLRARRQARHQTK